MVGLCCGGIFLSAYLALSHYRVHTDIGYQSFCALSKTINCDTVSQSPLSVWLGLPLAVWGVAFYTALLILALFAAASFAGRRRGWAILFAAASGGSLASIGFAGISAFFIRSWCIVCLGTYAINFLLVYLIWIIRRRFQIEPFWRAFGEDLRSLWWNLRWSGPVLALFWGGLLLVALHFPPYWEIRPSATTANVPTGMTPDGHPWRGAESPVLDIVEFSDYQCFQCRKMHHYLLEILARHPGNIRVVHRHFPMDHEYNPIVGEPFHIGSGRMAILAIHAANQGKFAEMNDWLFSKAGTKPGAISIAEAAAATGLDAGQLSAALHHTPYRLLLKRDIHEGLKLGIAGTPSYLINGQLYEGNLPAEVLQPLLKTAGAK